MNQQTEPANTDLTADAAWLAKILQRKAGKAFSEAEVKEVDERLARVALGELLRVFELARPARQTVIAIYQHWINANTGRSPQLFAAWYNLAVELGAAGDRANAITANSNALALKPDFAQAAVNMGLAQEAEGRPEEALATWQRALQADESRTQLLNHRGRVLEGFKRYDDAERALRLSLQTNPQQPDALQHWVHLRQKMCKWPIFGVDTIELPREQATLNMGPLGALAEYDDIATQYRIAESWLQRKIAPAPKRLAPANGYAHDKIRIGYLSSDFCMHAMSYLIAELFERHDRDRFEVFGYCSTKDDGSDVRRRVIGAFDKYVRVKELGDEQAAEAIRKDEIDILVDLNGLTQGGRLGLLRWKPAPVQITYLGYIGSVPLPELDYMLCDEYVVPKPAADGYWPKPLYLPGIFQCNDTKLAVGPKLTRAEAGIPDDKFVFCCFSNHYKITEPVYAAWMAVMRRVESSILWLAADTEWSTQNLRAAAAAQGVAPERIVFGQRVAPALYLARMALADLFLDTFPYNAGTVASDALRMGLPLVTLSGRAFASRMAGSLLNAVGRGAEIATSLDQYVEIAVALAADRKKHAELRRALSDDRWRKTVGNIELFTSQYEAVLASVVKRPAKTKAKPAPKPKAKAGRKR